MLTRNLQALKSSGSVVTTVQAYVPSKLAAVKNIPTVVASASPQTAGSHVVVAKAAVQAQLASSATKTALEEAADKSPALSSQSMDELYREVQELEKQEKLAMATRAAALQKAMDTTSNCDAKDQPCAQAHLDVKWKSAKDKYEQAAFNDVIREEKERNTTTLEGEAEFKKISATADQLSGLKELKDLNNKSAAAVSLRAKEQRSTMSLLRKENKALEQIKQQEAALRAKNAAERQKAVEDKMKAQADADLRAMSYSRQERLNNENQALQEARAASAAGATSGRA
eukprot:CAMPEP_0113687754 /NCGR_PEP_ID=MMETSP0038_2-20120614/16125_1 /TAXON_ID=2898 /ORGANISM="Cryptomonas paramecium" /LENGTH=284 /DNA_ID=CAMNT_0000608431 /DNA_START=170 /DNA_END=1021 /DNA_ORIENTATION=- /assembly_acc=CAM_ASM_000170